MNKTELIEKFAQERNLSKAEAKRQVEALEMIIKEELLAGGEITFTGFVKLYTRKQNAREVYNPYNKGKVQIPERIAPAAKFSKSFRDQFVEG